MPHNLDDRRNTQQAACALHHVTPLLSSRVPFRKTCKKTDFKSCTTQGDTDQLARQFEAEVEEVVAEWDAAQRPFAQRLGRLEEAYRGVSRDCCWLRRPSLACPHPQLWTWHDVGSQAAGRDCGWTRWLHRHHHQLLRCPRTGIPMLFTGREHPSHDA